MQGKAVNGLADLLKSQTVLPADSQVGNGDSRAVAGGGSRPLGEARRA